MPHQKLQDYGKILQQMKENPLALPKAPNKELLEHEKKRKAEAKLYSMKKEMITKGENPEKIDEVISAERKKLYSMIENGEVNEDLTELGTLQ